MTITRRPATDADMEFAKSLHAACYRDVVIAQFGVWDQPTQTLFFQQKWREGGAEIIELAGVPAGLIATHWHPDDLYVSEIQVAPSHQGCGIGSGIMSELIAQANSRRLPIHLQVLLSSRAREWYSRLGFIPVEQSATHVLLKRPFEI